MRAMPSTGRILLAALAILAPARPAQGDPWLRVQPIDDFSAARVASGGWILVPADADSDPVLSDPMRSATGWIAAGTEFGATVARVGVGLMAGESTRLTLRLVGRRSATQQEHGLLAGRADDLNGDGLADQLFWRRTSSPGLTDARNDLIGARVGLRHPRFGLGLAWRREVQSATPLGATFSFPLTNIAVAVTGEATSLYDLDSGDRLYGHSNVSELGVGRTTDRAGFDFGIKFLAVAVAAGVGWEREQSFDTVATTERTAVSASNYAIEAGRDLERSSDYVRAAARIDGKHGIASGAAIMWNLGADLRKRLTSAWSGTETLALTSAGAGGSVVTEWVREYVLRQARGYAVETVTALGLSHETADFLYGVGLTWRFEHTESGELFADALQYRVDDPGIPGQRGRTFTDAHGGGSWDATDREDRQAVSAGFGARYALNERFGILAGGELGFFNDRRRNSRELVSSEPIAGSAVMEPAVVDPVAVPYANLTVGEHDDVATSGLVIDVNAGFSLTGERAQVSAVFGWTGDQHTRTLLEGIWRF